MNPSFLDNKPQSIIRGLLAVLIVTPALALGAVHTNVLAVYLVFAAVLLLIVWQTQQYSRPVLDLVSGTLLGLSIFTLFQLIPLPAGLVEFIAPAVHEVRIRSLRPLGEAPPHFMPLTLDSSLTFFELGKLVLYLAVYWTCLSWTRRHGSDFVLKLIIATGAAGATVFLLHKLLMLDRVYGFYLPIQKSFGHESSSAPLINENHMAGMLGICTAIAIGKALSVHERTNRLIFLGLSALIGGSLMLTLSRGGIASFIGGQIIFVALRVIDKLRRTKKESSSRHLIWIPVGLSMSIGLGMFVAQDAIIGEFQGGDLKKLDLFFEGLPLVERFWTTGVGRGAFWVGFPLVSELAATTTYTHAENSVVQILADYGIPIGGTVLIIGGIIVGRFLINAPRRVEIAAALAALIAFGSHNLLDFNMEIPGVAILAVAILAVLSGSSRADSRDNTHKLPRVANAVQALVASGLALAMFLHFANHSIQDDDRRYLNAWKNLDFEPFSEQHLEEVLVRHPADWYIPFIVGVRHYYLKTDTPIRWLARAIELNPAAASAHLYIGAVLLEADYFDQAMLELRIASRHNNSLVHKAVAMLEARESSFETLSKMAVTREDKKLIWNALALRFEAKGKKDEAEAADLALLELDPMHPGALMRHARRLSGRQENERALQLAHKLGSLPDLGPAGIQLESSILEKAKRHEEAIAVLERGLVRFPKNPALLNALAWSLQRAGKHDEAIKTARTIKGMMVQSRSRSQAVLLEYRLLMAEGKTSAALASLREAHSLDPGNTSILLRIANLAEQKGDKRRALDALRKLKLALPGDKEITERIEKIESIKYLQTE